MKGLNSSMSSSPPFNGEIKLPFALTTGKSSLFGPDESDSYDPFSYASFSGSSYVKTGYD